MTAGLMVNADRVRVKRQWRSNCTSPAERFPLGRPCMASAKQRAAARRNIRKAAAAARRKRTITRLSRKTRTALGKEGAKAAKRKRRRKK